MVFRTKRAEMTFKPGLRKGFCLQIRGKTLVKGNKKDTQNLTKVGKRKASINDHRKPTCKISAKRPEIEKCADCEPDHRYAILSLYFHSFGNCHDKRYLFPWLQRQNRAMI